ncbi:Glycerophosphocholine phosphodiesterase [Tieghemiomyces parasiticus]|uniref:Glycerophosphocholine phosphodiesterase n=1 Tax=Tieghemiomyces parasiticus TaxID=78921 RepID=A0A9W8DNC8_9FUNG|nr:Glycerophosphocholine phosphodiesterase [Tieghemiomyces parasiticus]
MSRIHSQAFGIADRHQHPFTAHQVNDLTAALQADDCDRVETLLAELVGVASDAVLALPDHAAISDHPLGRHLYLIFEGACLARAHECLRFLTRTYPTAYQLYDVHGRTVLHRLCMLNGITPSLDRVFTTLPLRSPMETLPIRQDYFASPSTAAETLAPADARGPASTDREITQKIKRGTAKRSNPHVGTVDTTDLAAAVLPTVLAHLPTAHPLVGQDFFGRTPLHYAAVNGFAAVTHLLLRSLYRLQPGTDINSPAWCDHDGCTPLFYAVINNHFAVVRTLVDQGKIHDVDLALTVPNTPTPTSEARPLGALARNRGDPASTTVLSTSQSFLLLRSHLSTPLAIACKLGLNDIAAFLLARGANCNSTDEDGETPLHLAARGGHVGILKLLVRAEASSDGAVADLNHQDARYGWTPLEVAAREGHLACVQLLIDAGADPNVLDFDGWNAHERATYHGHCAVTEVLRPISRKPGEALRQFRNPTSTAPSETAGSSPGRPALATSVPLNGEANKSFIERTYGHRHLQERSLLVLTLGSNATTDLTAPLQLRSDFFERVGGGITPTTTLALTVAATGAVDPPVTLELPLERQEAPEPLQFLCSPQGEAEVTVQFDLVPSFGGDLGRLLGRASVQLPVRAQREHILTSAAGCERVQVALMSTPGLEVLGHITFEYIMINPFSHPKMTVNPRSTYWKSLKTKVIGHRGSGMNRDTAGGSNLQVGENTVLSFVTAANLGAEYVEFDVQLTKDLVPVIYHDWTVTETGVDVPIHSLTRKQFLALDPRSNKDYNKGHIDPSFRFGGREAEKQAVLAMRDKAENGSTEGSHGRAASGGPRAAVRAATAVASVIAPVTTTTAAVLTPPPARPDHPPSLARANTHFPRVSRSNSVHERKRSPPPSASSSTTARTDGAPPTPPIAIPNGHASRPVNGNARSAAALLSPPLSNSVSTSSCSSVKSTATHPATITAAPMEDEQLHVHLNEELEKVLTLKQVPKKVKGNNAETIQAPFTTLEETFRQVPAHIGFNIEVKYPMKCEAEDAGVWSHLELNRFVDSILQVVYDLADTRSVIFSSFHPDICLLLNVKQPTYPVFFLTDGGTWPYVDARCNSLDAAVRFARNAGLLGIVSVSTLILQAPVLAPAIKGQGLLLFTYGTLNNSVACVQLQRKLDVDAVIVDSVMAVRKGLQESEVEA